VSFVVTMSGKFLTGVPLLVTINNWAFFSGLVIGFTGYLLLSRRPAAART
jgi:allantoin permease